MTIFAVIGQPSENAARLPDAVAREFPQSNLEIAPKTWLVAAAGTPVEISNRLGVTDGTNGTAVILEVGGYYGRASTNIWAWIKAHQMSIPRSLPGTYIRCQTSDS
jgi:hypothetical protein